jgi:hypothetical protein
MFAAGLAIPAQGENWQIRIGTCASPGGSDLPIRTERGLGGNLVYISQLRVKKFGFQGEHAAFDFAQAA